MMVSTDYVFHHVECVIAALKGDARVLEKMDISAEGFWRSFAAIAYSLPALFFTWVLSARMDDAVQQSRPLIGRIAFDAVFDIGVWLVLISILILLLGQLGYGKRITHFVIARNWTTLLFNYVMAFALVPSMFRDASGIGALTITFALVVTVWAFIRVTRQSLQSGAVFAAALVIGEVSAVIALGIIVTPTTI